MSNSCVVYGRNYLTVPSSEPKRCLYKILLPNETRVAGDYVFFPKLPSQPAYQQALHTLLLKSDCYARDHSAKWTVEVQEDKGILFRVSGPRIDFSTRHDMKF